MGTKIVKGSIEIVRDATIIKRGCRVGSSEATFLSTMNIKPFSYFLKPVKLLHHGVVYDSGILEFKDESLRIIVETAISSIQAFSIELSVPTPLIIPHLMAEGYVTGLALKAY